VLALNLLVAAVLAALLPAGLSVPRPSFDGMPLAPVPVWPIAVFLLCLPTGWLGMKRLHDVGQAGWHAWLPLAAFAGATFMPSLMQPLLKLVMKAQDAPIQAREFASNIIMGARLAALLAAAGSLRTVFLWLEPGDPQENRYGQAPSGAPAAVESKQRAPVALLAGRMRRLPFWLLLAANVAFVHAAIYTLAHWPGMSPPGANTLSWLTVSLYLPSLGAAALRLHDRNRSGILSFLVLAANLAGCFAKSFLDQSQLNMANVAIDIITIYLLFQCLQPGDADQNRYGPPPGHEPEPRAPQQTQALLRTVTPPPANQTPARSVAAKPVARRGFGRRGV
jgi:uncharacterized membrane protein YhaH (DUF805 family)